MASIIVTLKETTRSVRLCVVSMDSQAAVVVVVVLFSAIQRSTAGETKINAVDLCSNLPITHT